ncbi:MAG: hypothetical protein Kow00124_24250 [Anaerolineae bacterium]
MAGLDALDTLYVVTALLFHSLLVIHFALRRWRFELAVRLGWIFYALSLPAAGVSLVLLSGGRAWGLWLGGFLFLVWATFGFIVEYIRQIEWRAPIRWPIFGPYVTLYLATAMFYWWPVALVSRPLWFVCGALFLIASVLNVSSHRGPQAQ